MRYIELFQPSGEDPVTGKDIPPRAVTYERWTPELERLAEKWPQMLFSCIEKDANDKVTACLNIRASMAREWIDKGREVLGVSDITKAYAPAPSVGSEALALIGQMKAELDETRARLAAIETKKGGK